MVEMKTQIRRHLPTSCPDQATSLCLIASRGS